MCFVYLWLIIFICFDYVVLRILWFREVFDFLIFNINVSKIILKRLREDILINIYIGLKSLIFKFCFK